MNIFKTLQKFLCKLGILRTCRMTTNYEKIKAMSIDEMVEFFTQEYDSNFTDGYCTPTICYECKLSTQCDEFKSRLKQWLQQEAE